MITYFFFLPLWATLGIIHLIVNIKPRPFKAVFRMQAGLDGTSGLPRRAGGGLDNAGGHLPDIRVYNDAGEFLGKKMDPGWVVSGEVAGAVVALEHAVQPTYTLFTGNKDAICIAYITTMWQDGQGYAWFGDWAHYCGRTWYYSNIYLDGRLLKCAWLDSDGDTPVTGLQIHWPSLKAEGLDSKIPSKDFFCGQTPTQIFRYDSEPDVLTSIWDRVDPATTIFKRSQPARQRDTRLVRSNHTDHEATRLCEDVNSAGPDLLSLGEGAYCDMDTRQVWEICADDGSDDCFDAETLQTRPSRQGVGKRQLPTSKVYSAILDWA